MNDIAQLLNLKSKWDYQHGRWHVEASADRSIPFATWGGSGSTMEEAVDNLLRNILRDVCKPAREKVVIPIAP